MTCSDTRLLAHSLYFSYENREILSDVSLSIRAGELVAITGENGSGKSTLLELLAGIMAPDRGLVERSCPVSLVVQRPAVPDGLPLTAGDVVAMGTWRSKITRKQRQQEVSRTLAHVELPGFETRDFTELSGGQRQRVLVAQGLVQHTGILLLDEPLVSMDSPSRTLIHEILRSEVRQGLAVVLVTHDEDSKMLADRIVELRHPDIVEPDFLAAT
ncbi:metal ABC transporter ATP-binding protein [Glutamicibacter sp.]|uniref:metal ABC transporter ATP-binding protein n=1 Tax=Glutamicibacter sp. TaxID=1931995 RepID=UPI002B4A106D|nr:ATP-binding cassette domain-containing protein [Glutamicibacter sp.]HJX78908.1 ATP-binding cassette domain-containing protein [Glutamicibacter sp.]